MEPLALHIPLSYALRLLETRFRGADITVTVEIPADLPLLWGATDQLELVFLNLLVNAWQAMPEGGTVTVQAEVLGDQYVRIVLRDTGMGMASDALARAFDPLFTTREGHRSGLGLTICRQIVERHQGTLSLDSTPGAGTTVTIELRQANATGKGGE